MKNLSQKEQMENLMKEPAPKKKVGIIQLKMIREGTSLYGTTCFQQASEAVEMIEPIFSNADREMIVVLSLDVALAPIAIEVVAVGGLCHCSVDIRNIFKHAILSNAAKIICFHNHPSGSLKPSPEDSNITAKIKEAGELVDIPLIDHILLGLQGKYISFRDAGIAPFSTESE